MLKFSVVLQLAFFLNASNSQNSTEAVPEVTELPNENNTSTTEPTQTSTIGDKDNIKSNKISENKNKAQSSSDPEKEPNNKSAINEATLNALVKLMRKNNMNMDNDNQNNPKEYPQEKRRSGSFARPLFDLGYVVASPQRRQFLFQAPSFNPLPILGL